MAQIFGYARVSTREQNEARQLLALREFGVEDGRIFTDRQSGKDFDRPAYRRLVRRLRPGDTLAVKSIDRLGRNYREILEQWRILTHERRVGVVVLDMPLLDTRQERDLAGMLTADIVLQLLSYVAETERAFIRQRQAEGIAAARARGQTFGRPRLEVPPAFAEVYRRWNSGKMSSRAAAERLGISQPTFLRWTREAPPVIPRGGADVQSDAPSKAPDRAEERTKRHSLPPRRQKDR